MTWPTFGRGDDSYSAELLKGTSYTAELEQSASVENNILLLPVTPCRIHQLQSRFMARIKMFMDVIRLALFPDS